MADGAPIVNGMNVIYEGSPGKSMAAMPDTSLGPVVTPAGPTPTPFPNNSDAGSTKDGAASVTVKGKPVATKKSKNDSSKGNESSKGTGGAFSNSGTSTSSQYVTVSSDVKAENEGVARHLDTMTHQHGPG